VVNGLHEHAQIGGGTSTVMQNDSTKACHDASSGASRWPDDFRQHPTFIEPHAVG
jgi:hypothetical protein